MRTASNSATDNIRLDIRNMSASYNWYCSLYSLGGRGRPRSSLYSLGGLPEPSMDESGKTARASGLRHVGPPLIRTYVLPLTMDDPYCRRLSACKIKLYTNRRFARGGCRMKTIAPKVQRV